MREDGERNENTLPIGQRLFPCIYFEKLIQDVTGKSIVEELRFSNFHTMILGGRP